MAGYIPSFQSLAKGSLGTVAVLVGGTMGALWVGQTTLIYPASIPAGSREYVPTPDQYDMPYEDLTLTAKDNVKIRAYLILRPQSRSGSSDSSDSDSALKSRRTPTVLLLHANAGNMGHRLPLARMFYQKMKCNVFMLSYRGYGLSEGRPSEKGIRLDAQTAMQYILAHPVLQNNPIFLYGQSLGGAVAIDLASHFPDVVNAVIIENTFLSIPKLIPTVLPLLSPLSFLCHQVWDSQARIALIPRSVPMLFLAGKADELIAPVHMRTLYEIACHGDTEKEGGERRMWWDCERGDHNNTCAQPGYWRTVADFVKRWR